MRASNELGCWLDEGDVAVGAEAQDADVDRAVLSEPLLYA